MEVRKSNRVILESDALKSSGFNNTNNSITSLILNEDQNQLESELSFLEDESDMKSLSPQPQPDLLIDLGDISMSTPILDLMTTTTNDADATAMDLDDSNDNDGVDVIIQEFGSESGIGMGVVDTCTSEFDEFEPAGNLAYNYNDDEGTDDPNNDHELQDGLIHTNVKEQKMKEMTIMEQSTSSTSSSTSSIISSVVKNTSSSSTTTTSKSSIKATTIAAKEKTTVGSGSTIITATPTAPTTPTTPTTPTSTPNNKTASLSSSISSETVSSVSTINSNNINTNQITNMNGNGNGNEIGVITNTKAPAATTTPTVGGGTKVKKTRNNNKTSSESISVNRQWTTNHNNNCCSIKDSSTNQTENETSTLINGSTKIKDDVFSRVSVSFLRRSFDGDLNCLVDNHDEDDNNKDIVDHAQTQNESNSFLPIVDKNSIILNRPSSIHRPKSCLGIPNEVAMANGKRWNSDDTTTSKSQNGGAHIVFIPGDDFSGVSVNKLKSSFTKFDNLAKKEMKSTVSNNKINNLEQREQQESPEVSTTQQQPTHVCKGCNNEVFQMELVRAEKSDWHKLCFRCTICNKSLTLDSYSSNEGKIYCKPHFRELFKPKTVTLTEEESLNEKIKKKVEVIIRESEPVPLPPDVVRASEKSGPDIQDLKLDVKSKFELFESLNINGGGPTDEGKENRAVEEISEELKRTGSVQSRLAKYQSRVAAATSTMEVTGVADEDLAGGGARRRVKEDGGIEEEGESSGDEVMDPRLLRKTQPVDEINLVAIDEVRSKWELGINSKKEEISEARREEQSKFRCRLLLGKNTQMKDMYEKACEETTPEKEVSQQSVDMEVVKSSDKKAKDLKELFEKGEPLTPQPESKLEKEVFESEIAKNSRSLFKEMDKCVASGTPMSISPVNRQGQFVKRLDSSSIRKHEVVEGTEVVRSSDVAEDVISPEDISTKFKFFETFEEKMSEKKKERFRMTPPRDLGDKESSPPVEIYRDPNIIRSSDPSTDPDIPATRTASKMLSVFRQLEQEKNETGDAKKSFKPLKEFTPPRETLKTTNGHDESGDSQEGEEDSGDEDVLDDGRDSYVPTPGDVEKDELLKQVGSLARATSLRLKFERWEREENARNKDTVYDPNLGMMDEEQESSIESTKELRAKFENYKDTAVEHEKIQKMRRGESLKVKRFVELTNNTGTNMDNCTSCEKRVYVMEKIEAGGKVYHKTCFRCSHCKTLLRMDTFTSNKGVLFCTPHFKQLFKIKGNYDEGFGHETQRQAWEKKKRAAEAGSNAEEKEN